MKQFTHLGFNNWINSDEIDVVQIPKGAPTSRFIKDALDRHVLIDVTQGRRTKSVIVMKSGNIIVSAMAPDTIIGRIEGLQYLKEAK